MELNQTLFKLFKQVHDQKYRMIKKDPDFLKTNKMKSIKET